MIIDFHVHIENIYDSEKYSVDYIVDAMENSYLDRSVILGKDQAGAGYKQPWED